MTRRFLPRAACPTEPLTPLSIRRESPASLERCGQSADGSKTASYESPVKVFRVHDPRRLPSKVSFLSIPGARPDTAPTTPCGLVSELRACRGFAATITLSYVPSIATLAPPVERSNSHRPRHPCTPVPLLAVPALPRCQTQPSTSATLRTTHEHDSDRTFPSSLARWPFGQPALQTIIRLGELCSEPLGLISMLRIASKQPHPKKRTPVTVHRPPFPVRARARARAEQTDEARVKVKPVQFPGDPTTEMARVVSRPRIPKIACAALVPSRCRIEPLVSPSPGAMQDGACTFARARPRSTFWQNPAKGGAFGLTEVLATVRNEHTAGIAPSSARRASRSRRPRERVLQAGETAPFWSSLASPRIDVRSGGGRLDERASRE